MRHVSVLSKCDLRAGKQKHVVEARDALFDHRILRVKSTDTIDDEGIAVVVGDEGADGGGPDTSVIFFQFEGPRPFHPIPSQCYFRGFRRVYTEGHTLVTEDFW